MNYLFEHLLGMIVCDENGNSKEKYECHSLEDYYKKNEIEKKIRHTFKDLQEPSIEIKKRILETLKHEKNAHAFVEYNRDLTKEAIKNAVTDEFLIIETINAIDDLSRVENMLTKRLRNWFALLNPEYEHVEADNEKLVERIHHKKTEKRKGSMGADLHVSDQEPIIELASEIEKIRHTKIKQEHYLEKVMNRFCPNVTAVAGGVIGARLLVHTRSLQRLAMMPASTVQLLGAEQALFRHLRTGAKSPRHGLILAHPLLVSAPQAMHGKIARALADKISIAAKIDFFKGTFIGDALRKALEEKFS